MDNITSAATATLLLVALAMGAIIERAIIGAPGAEDEEPRGDGELTGPPPPNSQSRSPITPPRAAPQPATSLTREVEKLTLTQRGSQASRSYRSKVTSKPIVRFTRVDSQRTSALGTSVIPLPRASSAMPEATVFVGQKAAGRWRVALAGTDAFDALLQRIPGSLIPSAEKSLLAEFSDGTIKRRQTDTGLMLPWRPGEAWALQAEAGNGDEASAPSSFLGFSRRAGKVLAAGGGRIYRLCSSEAGRGLIMVIHPNGLATQYYQMSKVTTRSDGSVVERGDYLGTVGTDRPCGGVAAARPQVWFGVRDAASGIALDGKEVGGWRFVDGKGAAGVSAVRGLSRIVAGKALQNLESGLSAVLPLPGSETGDDAAAGEESPSPPSETPGPSSPVSLPPVGYGAPKA